MKKKVFIFSAIVVCFISVARAEVLKIPLNELAPVQVADLKSSNAEYVVKIPVAARWKVNRALLRFSYVNSSVLLSQNSRLIVRLNGISLAQIKLNPAAPEGEAEVLLPGTLLSPGYNDLTFNAIQHYPADCEDPYAPELWTTLKLNEASLEFDYTLRPMPLKLTSVADFLFDPREFPSGKVNIIAEKASPEIMTAVAVIASGIALRFDYRKVFFTCLDDIKNDCDNVLVGSRKFVEGFLSEKGIKVSAKGPFLKIVHLPKGRPPESDANHALLIVCGDDTGQIKMAAETITVLSFSDAREMELMDITLPKVYSYTGKLILKPGKKHEFKDLNLRTHTFQGRELGPKALTVRLPTDLLIKPNQYADISLHFIYGAGMRQDSVLNVLLNGKHVAGIHLADVNGGVFSGYKVTIPTYLFQRGANTITFEPVLTPLVAKPCEFVQSKNLFLTLFEDSSLYFPDMPHLVDLPRIELLFQDGFPLTRWPDGREIMVCLTGYDSSTVSAALNFIGAITQKVGYPLLNIRMAVKEFETPGREMIVVGTVDTIPEGIKRVTPLRLTNPSMVAYPVFYRLQEHVVHSMWQDLKTFMLSLFHREPVFPVVVDVAYSRQISSLGSKRGALMQLQSPQSRGRSMIILTATNRDDVEELSKALLEPAVQANSYGDLVLADLEGPPYKVTSWDVGPRYYSNASQSVLSRYTFLSFNMWLFSIVLIVIIFILSFGIYSLLKRYRKRRIAGA